MFIYTKDNKIMAMSEVEKDYSDLGWEREETDEEIVQVKGILYRKSEVPEPSEEEKAQTIRNIRNQYLEEYVDKVVSNPLRWADLSDEEKANYTNYRRYLLDIPQDDNFPNIKVMTFEEYRIAIRI